MPEIIFENSGWWLILILTVSAVLSAWLYGRSSGLTRGQALLLAVIRFLIFSLLGFLLLSPLIQRNEEKEEKPFLVLLKDVSLSMTESEDSEKLQSVEEELDGLSTQLDEKYRVNTLTFDLGLHASSDSGGGDGSNLEKSLNDLQDLYYNRNLGAVVLFSDGIYNQGSDPGILAQRLAFPVYTLVIGDSLKKRDLLIERLVHNKVSYLNNEFPLEVYMRARSMSGEEFTMTVYDPGGNEVFQKRYTSTQEDFFIRESLFLAARKEGFQRYSVVLESENGGEPVENNRSVFSIEVLTNKKKILLVSSAPHPDLAAIKGAVQSADRYEIVHQMGAGIPDDGDFDLVILHEPDIAVLNSVLKSETPYWLLLGPNTQTADFEVLTAGEKGYEESQVHFNREFDLFNINSGVTPLIDEFPPLWTPFGSYEIEGTYHPLLFKRIGNIKTLDPAWIFRYDNEGTSDRRSSILLGTGLWRWRLHTFREDDSFTNFDDLVLRTVQFLTTSSRRDRFDVDLANRFRRSERIMGEARLFNSSLELVNDPEVMISFTSESSGEEYNFSFVRSGNTYRLNAGSLPPGVYDWKAATSLSEEDFSDAGKILVEEQLIELSDLVSRPGLMRKIAQGSGGAAFKSDEIENLKEALLNNSSAKSYRTSQLQTRSLIENKWPFFLLLILMTFEWGLRKFFGRY